MKGHILWSMVREFKGGNPRLFRKLVIGASVFGVVSLLLVGVAGYFLFQGAGFLMNQAAVVGSSLSANASALDISNKSALDLANTIVPAEIAVSCWDYLSRLAQVGTWLQTPLGEIGSGFQKSCLGSTPPGPI